MSNGLVDPIRAEDYHWAMKQLRSFFVEKEGFIEVAVQHRQSILAACEDPMTIATYNYTGKIWPLPQTGQMHLEYELLRNPKRKGLFCITTSYREEPEPVEGRHNLIFPMFEFETHGGLDELKGLLERLIVHVGFVKGPDVPWVDYRTYAKAEGVDKLDNTHEAKLETIHGAAALLGHFPLHTSPFWNMKVVAEDGNGGQKISNKIDAIVCGIETIGSAERSCEPNQMRQAFYAVSGGRYAKTLFGRFGRDRVTQELEEFLALPFFPRCGAGIGITRLIRGAQQMGLIK